MNLKILDVHGPTLLNTTQRRQNTILFRYILDFNAKFEI